MKIAFYFPYATVAGAGPASILQGLAPASGTNSSIRLGAALHARGHQVEVVHHAPDDNKEANGVVLVRSPDRDMAVKYLATLPKESVVILPPMEALEMLYALRETDSLKVLWLHNNQAIDWLDAAFATGLDRAVCVTRAASLTYRPYSFNSCVEVIPYSLRDAIELDEPAPLPHRVAFVGALTESKGFQHVLQAWPLIRKQVKQAQLDVFGSVTLHAPDGAAGPSAVMSSDFLERWWNPFVLQMGGEEATGVTLHGALPKPELFRRLSVASVGIVNPNMTGSVETFCLSAVEMQACGVPCIGGGTGGLLDTIANGGSGFHLQSQRPEEIADRVVSVLLDPALRHRLSCGALAHASLFKSPDREAADFEAVFGRIRRGDPSPRHDWGRGDFLRVFGYGKTKLALKKWLRPEPAAALLRNRKI